MPTLQTKRIVLAALAAIALLTAVILRRYSSDTDGSARTQFLRFVPSDATSVIFVDLDALRASPFLKKFYAWAPHPAEDSDYAQFVRETGFNYENDLQRLFIARANRETGTATLVFAEGKFNRAKIQSFLARNGKAAQQGSLQVYVLPASAVGEKPLSVALLGDHRVAITNSPDLFQAMAAAVKDPGHADWQSRFDRLAGSPVFAVIRHDPALQQAVNSVTPGGFQSPQLAALLDELQWVSIAGKPDGDLLRVVAEGETSSDAVSSQLRDFLQGIQLLAQNGLNDPQLRREMNPAERGAYLDLLNSADIQRLERRETKSVRLVLNITPRLLELAASFKPAVQDTESTPQENRDRSPKTRKPHSAKKK